MRKKQTLTIGIPAYNEQTTIKQVIQDLLLQKEENFILKKIIVFSDGSTDATIKEVKSIKDKRVEIRDDKKRLGKSARLNQFFHTVTSDVVALIDADVVITDKQLFARIFKSVFLSTTGIIGINATPLQAKNFFEQSINTGVYIMKNIAKQWNNGDNYLSFKGCFLVIEGKLARSIRIPHAIANDDAYLYFSAVKKGLKPCYLEKCKVFYRSPMILEDHIKQSSRYQNSQQELKQYFGKLLQHAYNPPLAIVMASVLQSLLLHPIHFFGYIGIYGITKLRRQRDTKSGWSVADSTKKGIVVSG